jgi:hypothetical protein
MEGLKEVVMIDDPQKTTSLTLLVESTSLGFIRVTKSKTKIIQNQKPWLPQ